MDWQPLGGYRARNGWISGAPRRGTSRLAPLASRMAEAPGFGPRKIRILKLTDTETPTDTAEDGSRLPGQARHLRGTCIKGNQFLEEAKMVLGRAADEADALAHNVIRPRRCTCRCAVVFLSSGADRWPASWGNAIEGLRHDRAPHGLEAFHRSQWADPGSAGTGDDVAGIAEVEAEINEVVDSPRPGKYQRLG